MSKTQFNYFVSDADANMYKQYQLGLSKALQRFSVDGVVLTTIERNAKEDTFVICAHSAQHETIAGIRLEIKSQSNLLPIEKCDVPQRKLILNKIQKFTQNNKSIAELSGLWVSAEHKGADLGRRLVLEATELALGLGVNSLIAMPPTPSGTQHLIIAVPLAPSGTQYPIIVVPPMPSGTQHPIITVPPVPSGTCIL